MSQVVRRFGALNYARCKMLMLGRPMISNYKIGPNTWLINGMEDKTYEVIFHKTHIIIFHIDGRIILNSGGYRSTTTKQRMNALIRECSIYQHKHVWRVRRLVPANEYVDEEYYDGINVGIRDLQTSMVHAAYFGDELAKKMVHDLREDDVHLPIMITPEKAKELLNFKVGD